MTHVDTEQSSLSARTSEAGDWPILQPYLDAILASLQAAFADRVATIDFYDPAATPDATTALLLDLDSFAIGVDPGDDRTPALTNWQLHCLFPTTGENAEVQIRSMTAELITFVRHNKWGLGPQLDYPFEITASAGPADSSNDTALATDQLLHWSLVWQQTLYLIVDPASWPEFLPDDLYSSFEPQTGDAYADQYQLLEPVCEEIES